MRIKPFPDEASSRDEKRHRCAEDIADDCQEDN